jgi:hypothetical protein
MRTLVAFTSPVEESLPVAVTQSPTATADDEVAWFSV